MQQSSTIDDTSWYCLRLTGLFVANLEKNIERFKLRYLRINRGENEWDLKLTKVDINSRKQSCLVDSLS